MANETNEINTAGTKLLGESKFASRAAGFAGLSNAAIDYSLTRTNALFQQTQAASIEEQALERANILREEFISALGDADTSSARRGVKVGEGSTAINKERSSKALGEDIALRAKNAKSKANLLRTQAKIDKSVARGKILSGAFGGGAKIIDSYS